MNRRGTVRRVSAPPKLLLSCLVLVACACSSGGKAQPAASAGASDSGAAGGALPSALATPGAQAPLPNEERQKPLTGLGPCNQVPAAAEHDRVDGLVLPEGAVVTRVTPVDPLTNVQGYVPMTPVQVRAFYQTQQDLTIVSVEDEVHESEVLADVGENRLFVKSQAVCELGSIFVAIVAPAP